MNPVDLMGEAMKLPLWRSAIVATVGQTFVKIERMGADPQPEETHADFAEALIVLEGKMELECGGVAQTVRPHQMFVVPIGAPHRVLPGSEGVVLIVNMLPGAYAEWLRAKGL